MKQSELTAAELNAIYSPLWEKVPETKPKRLVPHMCDGPGECGLCASIANASRVAAEDWLICGGRANENPAREPFSIQFMAMMDGDYVVIREHWHWLDEDPTDPSKLVGADGRRVLTRGDTIHHALVAACLALAGAA